MDADTATVCDGSICGAALGYADLGWPVFPVHDCASGRCSCGDGAACRSPGKHSRIKDWRGGATTDPDTIRDWWRRWPSANVGIVTGRRSGLWVLDLDRPKGDAPGGAEWLASMEAEHGRLPSGPRQRTGSGGIHRLFRYPEDREARNKVKIAGAGVDCRGEGGCIVAPPSVHATGNEYKWDASPDEPLPDLPGWLYDAFYPPKVERAGGSTREPRDTDDRGRRYALAALDNACQRIRATAEGGRHDAVLREARTVGGYLPGEWIGEGMAREGLVEAAIAAGLGEDEARATVAAGLEYGKASPRDPPAPEPRDRWTRADDAGWPGGGAAPEPPPFDPDDPGPVVEEAPPRVPERAAMTPEVARERVGAWSLSARWDRWRRSLEAGPSTVLWPWPGTPAEMPNDNPGSGYRPAHLAPAPPKDRPRWGSLWSMVGPLWPDRTVVLVAGTGRGKTSFAVQVAEAAAAAGAPVLYASAELGTDELLARLVALRARGGEDPRDVVSWRNLLRIRTAGAVEALAGAVEALIRDCPGLYLWEPMGAERSGGGLQEAARAVSLAHGWVPVVVVVDYVQRFIPTGAENKRAATSDVSAAIRDLSRPGSLADEWPGAAVLALSSTARLKYEHFQSCAHLEAAHRGGMVEGVRGGRKGEVYQPPVPLEGMGKETGELEHDCSLLLCMTSDRPASSDPGAERAALVVVPKNRHGGEGAVYMAFHAASGRFLDRASPSSPPPKTKPDPGGKGGEGSRKARDLGPLTGGVDEHT